MRSYRLLIEVQKIGGGTEGLPPSRFHERLDASIAAKRQPQRLRLVDPGSASNRPLEKEALDQLRGARRRGGPRTPEPTPSAEPSSAGVHGRPSLLSM